MKNYIVNSDKLSDSVRRAPISDKILVRDPSRNNNRWYQQDSSKNEGSIGKPVPLTPTFLGSMILNQERSITRANSKRPGYKHQYPRILSTMTRRLRAVEILRYNYKLGMNRISRIVGCSTRTVFNDVQVLRKIGHKAFDLSRNIYCSSKKRLGILNSKGLFISFKQLIFLISSYIRGSIDTIDEAVLEKPP